ncbi:hypothetical protein FN846DRAFT_999075 [Sphaerosporella brunnea]|uniref:Uncharacterized protein n=1 Tax=Sphaerosporella brunnea TaxID=1250544 RepID=A0A5J5EIJ2_9PEZI|nr:hypothetical protein FN846DRAFT_999075 [Sphaerosporella brunnea]
MLPYIKNRASKLLHHKESNSDPAANSEQTDTEEKSQFNSDDFYLALQLLDEEIGNSRNLCKVAPIILLAVGGFVAVTYFGNRDSSHDLDYILDPSLPNVAKMSEKLEKAILVVAKKANYHDKWANDNVAVFAIGDRRIRLFRESLEQNVVLYQGKHLVVYAGKWEWVLEQKLKRIAKDNRQMDIEDSVVILKVLTDKQGGPMSRETIKGWCTNIYEPIQDSVLDTVGQNYQTVARSTLLKPFPWHFPVPTDLLHLSPVELFMDFEAVLRHHYNAEILRQTPLFRARDTPLNTLYRLYQDLCAGLDYEMATETEYFFLHTGSRWRLSAIPDPKEKDPVRYAILASMVEALVDAFNWRLDHGRHRNGKHESACARRMATNQRKLRYETPPEWTRWVPPLDDYLDLVQNGYAVRQDDPAFLRRNISAFTAFLYKIPF